MYLMFRLFSPRFPVTNDMDLSPSIHNGDRQTGTRIQWCNKRDNLHKEGLEVGTSLQCYSLLWTIAPSVSANLSTSCLHTRRCRTQRAMSWFFSNLWAFCCCKWSGEGFWADDTAVRLMAIKEGRPILMVIPAPDNEAKILVFPPSTAEPSLSAYYTPYGEYTYIPSVAYDPTAIVVCYNGSSHFWVTWLREPQEIGAESQMEMLEAYKQAGDMTSDFSVLAMKPVAMGSATATAV